MVRELSIIDMILPIEVIANLIVLQDHEIINMVMRIFIENKKSVLEED